MPKAGQRQWGWSEVSWSVTDLHHQNLFKRRSRDSSAARFPLIRSAAPPR